MPHLNPNDVILKKYDTIMKHYGTDLLVEYIDHTKIIAFQPREYILEIVSIKINGADVTRLMEAYGVTDELSKEILNEFYGRLS